jgi:hypothetical protein
MAAGRWDFDTRGLSSTYLELRAIHNVLLALNADGSWYGARVLIHTDSFNAHSILRKGGSATADVQEVFLPLLWYIIEQAFVLTVEWIPREQNVLADTLSKQNSSEWLIHERVFAAIQAQWAPHGFAVDLFASDTAHVLKPYYTYHASLGGAGVNAFAQSWPRAPAMGWCHPPFAIIGRALAYAAEQGSRLCFIVHYAPQAVWWARLIAPNGCFQPFVLGVRTLPPTRDLFRDANRGGALPSRAVRWHTLALLLDFGSPGLRTLPVPRL